MVLRIGRTKRRENELVGSKAGKQTRKPENRQAGKLAGKLEGKQACAVVGVIANFLDLEEFVQVLTIILFLPEPKNSDLVV